MNTGDVTVVLVTRGDQEDAIQRIIATLVFDDVIVWNNASPTRRDLGAFGRWAAFNEVATRYVYTQDDDCLTTGETQLRLVEAHTVSWPTYTGLTSNMDPDHNVGMPLLALPGWGAVIDRDAPARAMETWDRAHPGDIGTDDWNRVGCDIVIPVLIPSQMINLGHENLPHAWAANRTHVQPGYHELKRRYYREAAVLARDWAAA